MVPEVGRQRERNCNVKLGVKEAVGRQVMQKEEPSKFRDQTQ